MPLAGKELKRKPCRKWWQRLGNLIISLQDVTKKSFQRKTASMSIWSYELQNQRGPPMQFNFFPALIMSAHVAFSFNWMSMLRCSHRRNVLVMSTWIKQLALKRPLWNPNSTCLLMKWFPNVTFPMPDMHVRNPRQSIIRIIPLKLQPPAWPDSRSLRLWDDLFRGLWKNSANNLPQPKSAATILSEIL